MSRPIHRPQRILAMQRQRRHRRFWDRFDHWAPRIIFAVLVIDLLWLADRAGLI